MYKYFVLDGKEPVLEPDFQKWGSFFGNIENRRVAETCINDVVISTVFLGTDHGFARGRVLLFETLVFGGELDGEMERYSTWQEAEKGHEAMVRRVREQGCQRGFSVAEPRAGGCPKGLFM